MKVASPRKIGVLTGVHDGVKKSHFKTVHQFCLVPSSDIRWQNDTEALELSSTNVRRLGTLPDERLVQLFTTL